MSDYEESQPSSLVEAWERAGGGQADSDRAEVWEGRGETASDVVEIIGNIGNIIHGN